MHPFPPVALVSLTLILGAGTAHADPNALLYGADIDQAWALAVNSAMLKGWEVIEADAAYAIFEQVLEEDDWDGMPLLLIQVHASFSREDSGVRVELQADEVELPYTDDEWVYDVTDQYAANLETALSKLRARWDTGWRGSGDGAGSPVGAPPLPPAYAIDDEVPSGEVGTWAYYAERYAQSRGCELGEQGAILEAAGQGWEHHRVQCRNGKVLRVRCRNGDCTER